MRAEERRTVAVTGYLHGLSHGNLLAIPVFLTVAWRTEFSLDPVGQGLLAAGAYACYGITSLPFGLAADRRPPRPLLVACAAGIAASLALLAASPDLVTLAVALGALGVSSGIYHPTGLSLVSRTVSETGKGFGWHGMGGSLGVALGPAAVVALLGIGWPWREVAAVLTVPPLLGIAFVLASGIGRDAATPARAPDAPRSLLRPAFELVLLVYVFSGVTYWGSLTFLPAFVGTGSFVLLLGLGAVGQVLSGHLADRGRPERSLFGLSASAGALLLVLAATAAAPLLPAAWLFGFLLFSLEPLQNSLVTAEVARPLRGIAFGMTFLSVFGLGSLGAALAGSLLQAGQPGLLFAVLAGSVVASGSFGVLAARARRARA